MKRLFRPSKAQDHKLFYQINLQFHDVLYESAHTHFIADQAMQLRRRINPYRLHATYQPGRMFETLGEHERIMAAIEAGTSDEAQKAASEHVQLLGEKLTDFISFLPERLMKA